VTENKNLHNAKASKNDEFYTQYSDIENEVLHYKNQFENKIVLCNCDNPEYSNFFKFFLIHFDDLKLKKLITTWFTVQEQTSSFKSKFGQLNNAFESGDFRSDQSVKLLKQADIIVTNPPFSLFREFVELLEKHHKQYLILGDQNAVTYKEVFPLIKNNKLWLGYDNGGNKWFQVPLDYNIATEDRIKIEDNKKYFSMGRIVWFTNLIIEKKDRLNLTKIYYGHEKDYQKYDNYDAINVDKVSDIPIDYKGVMGVPITFLFKHYSNQFEIVDLEGTEIKGLLKNTEGSLQKGDKTTYARVLVRKK
jgi:hypothetical protein